MVDYSKWKKIDISDDEDDTHPNIDTASLFRMRHRARLERAELERKTRDEWAEKKSNVEKKLTQNLSAQEQEELNREMAELNEQKAKMDKRSKLQAWNVDTISSDSWSGTVLNKKCLAERSQTVESEEITEEELSGYGDHVQKYEAQIKEFAFHSRFEECRRYLLAHPNIVNSFTLDYMSLWCIQLHLDNKNALLEHVSRQAVMIQLILDLAKTAGGGIDPRSCLSLFFDRSAQSRTKFDQLLADELAEYKGRIDQAARMRIQHEMEKQEANPESLVGPGGLNAQEVFESLPPELQKCFESRSREELNQVFANMEPDVADYHLQRCIDAGLWTTARDENDEDEQMLAKILEQQNEPESFGSAGDVEPVDLSDDTEVD